MLADTRTAIVGYEPPVPIREHVVHGVPARVLVEMARDAELLVVGSHGEWGLAQAWFGSVSSQCAQHAHCSVVIVRPSTR